MRGRKKTPNTRLHVLIPERLMVSLRLEAHLRGEPVATIVRERLSQRRERAVEEVVE